MDALTEPLGELLKDLKEKWREISQEESLWSQVLGFVHAVDWTEPWIILLLCFHGILLASVLIFRKNSYFQAVVFIMGALMVYSSERLNSWLMQHWRSFARQSYFDPHGIFISTLFSMPLLFVLFVQLINYLREAASLLIALKRKQLVHRAQQMQKELRTGQAAKEKDKTQ